MIHFVGGDSLQTDRWSSLKGSASSCGHAADLNETEKVTLLGRYPETLHWVEDAVRQSRHYCNLLNQSSSAFPNFSFSETGSLMLLWPY